MSTTDHPGIDEVLDAIRDWPVARQVALARRILEATEPPAPAVSEPPKAMTLDQVIGMLRAAGPPPDDEGCRSIIEEERMSKYG